ncbi:MAG: aspartate aminotransferase family protein [Methylacidiphilales bacterium]|nr:aspartate aminotransferase family protein [Candidatus Methylacidiphilales bacterium]MDW8350000.1 aspartate aminotransferase family protein [Verrucomicrobiae bacterium]
MIEQRVYQLIAGQRAEAVLRRHDQVVLGNYARFPLLIRRGKGCYVWDEEGRRYLDFAQGIAVNALGHCHEAIVKAIQDQMGRLMHVSNLFYHEGQALLAERIVGLLGAGRVFFCNSGAEANEALIKLARRFGAESGRYHIITAHGSFHGRTMATLSATGQEKVKVGFYPLLPEFTHVPWNDWRAVESAVRRETVAILIEGIQGEGGVNVATPEFLTHVRRICDERNLLLLWDGVQCGMFRTGRFQSYERILEGRDVGFSPDAVAMAKSLGGGFPVGAVWVRDPLSQLMGPGSHGTTYGGNPLACAAALATFEVIQAERLDENIRVRGEALKSSLLDLRDKYPGQISDVRGYGGLLGIELKECNARGKVMQLIGMGLLTAAAGEKVVRLLPPLNVSEEECDQALQILSRSFA